MILSRNPVTQKLHDSWLSKLQKEFSDVENSKNYDYLSIIKYIEKSPQKYYSELAYTKYLEFLIKAKSETPDILSQILQDSENVLNISNKTLEEINNKAIHEIYIPTDPLERIEFLDGTIHYNLLKLYESSLYGFIYVISLCYLISNKKGRDNVDISALMEIIPKTQFSFINEYYSSTVRNSIAHGKVIYSDFDTIFYIDKKNKEEHDSREIVKFFDNLLDILNGFCLAFKVFYFTNKDFCNAKNIPIGQSFIIEELQHRLNAPNWKVINCLESSYHDTNQLNIYVKNSIWTTNYARLYCFYTAYSICSLSTKYHRIAISIDSNKRFSGWGTVTFHASQLNALIKENETNMNLYIKTLENFLLFPPKIQIPSFFEKIRNFIAIVSIMRLVKSKERLPYLFTMKETQIYRTGNRVVIKDSSIIITPEYQSRIADFIQNRYKEIILLSIKKSRKLCGIFSLERYLPLRHIRVFIYDCDKRLRSLRNSGLIPELIATIEVSNDKRIRQIDIFNGIAEQKGKYRIVLYKKWRGIVRIVDERKNMQ